jgi:hypothetical protein
MDRFKPITAAPQRSIADIHRKRNANKYTIVFSAKKALQAKN